MSSRMTALAMPFKFNSGVTGAENETALYGPMAMIFCRTGCHHIQSVVRGNDLIPTLELNPSLPLYISFDTEAKQPLSVIDTGIDTIERFLPACLSVLAFLLSTELTPVQGLAATAFVELLVS